MCSRKKCTSRENTRRDEAKTLHHQMRLLSLVKYALRLACFVFRIILTPSFSRTKKKRGLFEHSECGYASLLPTLPHTKEGSERGVDSSRKILSRKFSKRIVHSSFSLSLSFFHTHTHTHTHKKKTPKKQS